MGMDDPELLFVKPCWGIFREHDVRTLRTYRSEADAIRSALQGEEGRLEVVVLDETGKTKESWTRDLRRKTGA